MPIDNSLRMNAFRLLLVAVIAYNQQALILSFIGRYQPQEHRLVKWENSTSLNNENCKVLTEVNACEDVKIHYPSSIAFLACGDPLERSHWYPPAGIRAVETRAEASFREQLFKYDIKTKTTSELEIRGLGGDFVTHGIEIFQLPDNEKEIHIFAVNHAREGESIAIFKHEIGSDFVQLVKNVKHPNIKTANGVAATGPLSFYVTNDHYWREGYLRVLEEMFGPWKWATHVQHCDASGDVVECRQVTGTFTGANGIAIWKDQLFVGDARNATVTRFQILENNNLEKAQTIPLGAAADNINILPTTGDPIVAVFPKRLNVSHYFENVKSLGTDVLVPVAALRLSTKNKYRPELIFKDDGSTLSFMTAAALDPYNNVFIGGSVLQYHGAVVCDLPPGKLKTQG